MRFAHVNHRYYPFVGGSERYIQELSEAIARRHEVVVATSNAFDLEYFWDSSKRAITAPADELLNGVQIHRYPVRHTPANSLIFRGGRRAMGEASRLGRTLRSPLDFASRALPLMPDLEPGLLKSGPFDLIHAANLGIEGLGIKAARVADKMDVPFVFTPFAHLGAPDDPVPRRYVSMPHQIRLLQRSQLVVAMTNIEASFIESLGIDRNRVIVTGVGVHPDEVTGGDALAARSKWRVTGALVGVAGAVAFDKGSHHLVEAVGRLRRRGHDIGLVLAGPRLEHFDRWFATLAARDREGIHLPGFITHEEKTELLAAIDVLAMPSRTESFGIAYLEGWVNEKPVIAARAGAVPEIVRHGETGLLVDYGDVDALATAILSLLESPSTALRLAQAGRNLTLQHFTWPAVIDRVLTGYSQVLGLNVSAGGVA